MSSKIKIRKRMQSATERIPYPITPKKTGFPQRIKQFRLFAYLKSPLALSAGVLISILLLLLLLNQKENPSPSEENPSAPTFEPAPLDQKSAFSDIFDSQNYRIEPFVFPEEQSFSHFFLGLNLPLVVINQLTELATEANLKIIKIGTEVKVHYSRKDETQTPLFISYNYALGEYAVFSLNPFTHLEFVQQNVEIKTEAKSGIIKDHLFNAILENAIPIEVIPLMEKALKWSVDFYHLNIGDRFKVIYEGEAINGKIVRVRSLKAIYFQNGGNMHYAFYMPDLDTSVYYDENGRSLRRSFLKAPIKYGFISSPFNPQRLHPVLNVVVPHWGTDYAAPLGTEIYAVGEGIVSAADRTTNNGNFIKIKHDQTYETQYLHMQSFAPGISKGSIVKQGDLIGFVGETGLATGPHVCFRFWKNGEQIDHLKEAIVLPEGKQLGLSDQAVFIKLRDSLLQQLKAI